MMKEEVPGVTFKEQILEEQEEQEGPVDELNEIIYKGETCVSKVRRRVRFFLTNITIEPVMLFYGVIRSIDYIAQTQLKIDKACLNDFNHTEEFCENLLDHEAENTEVQNEVAQFAVYESIVDHLFPIIGSMFLGSWSDNFGRKYLLYIYFLFCMVQTGEWGEGCSDNLYWCCNNCLSLVL